MPKGSTTTNQQKKQAAKRKARERRVSRAHNILTKNTSLKERARRRGEGTDVQPERKVPIFEAIRRMRGES